MKRGNLICLGVLVVLVCMQGFGAAAFRMVPSVYPTIQDAIDAANPDDIVMVANGTWKGLGNYSLDFGGKRLLVRSLGGPENCIIDCNGLGRAFHFHSGEDALSRVSGFTITNGVAVDFGGAIECYYASPTISNCIIRENTALDGGAIDCWGGSPSIVDCVITNNSSTYFGGAIECYESAATVENCLIRGNSAGELGGGVDCYDSTTLIINCTIVENQDGPGFGTSGGVNAEGLAYPTITNCILWDNTGDLDGPSATHSCIEDGDGGTGNISSNPEFRTGPLGDYYLSQEDAGQVVDSPCVDGGDANANDPNIALHTYTTRTDSVGDAYAVDMGYHYAMAPVVEYRLISYVVPGPDSRGTIDPNHVDPSDPNGLYKEFWEVYFSADPCEGYKVKKWTLDGNDVLLDPNDPSSLYTGLQYPDSFTEPPLIIDSNKVVTVEFEKALQYQVTVEVVGGVGGTFEVDPNRGTFDPCTGEYSGTFYEADVLQVTAKPNNPNYGVKWMIYYPDRSERCYPAPDPNMLSVPVDSNLTITLEFVTECLPFTARVVGGNGWVEPRRKCKKYLETVDVNAHPDAGHKVKVWTIYYPDHNEIWYPTPGDPNHIQVTMTDSIQVTVSFKVGPFNIIKVPFEYQTIQAAIDVAVDGYRIVVAPNPNQPYTVSAPDGIDFKGKKVILMSEDPNDPNVVAATIIDCSGDILNPCRAFHFHSGEDANTIVMGFTIRNGYQRGPLGANGQYGYSGIPPEFYDLYNLWIDPDDPENTPPRALPGEPNTGDGYAGAILCDDASPFIKNCVITDCVVAGARGGDGAWGQWGPWIYQPWYDWTDPDELPPALVETPDGQWGGHGGDGYGDGYGGAIACINLSSPTIIGCIIKDNTARGGVGGDGGWGGYAAESPNFDQGYESGSGSGGDGIGDGFGGGIYCENGSTATVRDCIFINNTATQGLGGIPGERGLGNAYTADDPPPQPLDGDDGLGFASYWWTGDIAGGAAYYGNGSDPNFTNCEFTNNMAVVTVPIWWLLELRFEDRYTIGGALYSGRDNRVTLNECDFVGNLGGAVYCELNSLVSVDKCSFRDNAITTDGGAIYAGRDGFVDVNDSTFTGNLASGNGGALNSESDANLMNCTFTGNRASGHGGAIFGYYGMGLSARLSFDVNSCQFGGNRAATGWGGGVYYKNFQAVFTDCTFSENIARSGGGLFLVGSEQKNGTVVFAGGTIYGNRAIGGDGSDMGGGLVCSDTEAVIENCTIRRNAAEGPYGSGGGISFYGGDGVITHLVKNCLLTDNSARVEGGAISCGIYTAPRIENCTFSNDSTGGLGGAVFCDWLSYAVITDSIFADCNGYAIVQEDFDDAIIIYCMFHNNLEDDYGVYDSNTGQIETFAGSALDATNINADPLFVVGPLGSFYLDQSASPAVNSGSKLAQNVGLDVFTTDRNGQLDIGVVDRGYHYNDISDALLFELTLAVVGNHGGTMGPTELPEPVAYDPVSNTYIYYAGTEVVLTAEPDIGYRVRAWSGTTNDASAALTNLVVMESDKHVTVEFRQPRTLVVGSDPNYTTIQHTIDDADDGDIVIIPSGRYTPAYLEGNVIPPITIIGKGITLTGTKPNDANVVAGTVLDGYVIWVLDYVPWYGLLGYDPNTYVHHPPTDTRTIIDGITLTNSNVWGDGGVIWIQNRSPIIRNCIFTDCHFHGSHGFSMAPCSYPVDGTDGQSVYGGAIAIYGGSPDIQNCVFRNCSATGGTGGRGADCDPIGSDGGWAGKAYGGAIYIDANSEPTIIDCSFTNCFARGGDGGDGGNGDFHGGRGGNWEWAPSIETGPFTYPYWWWWDGWYWETWYGPHEDYWKYSGYGGAIYSAGKSSPKIIRSTFTDNHSYGGVCGRGGSPFRTPDRHLNIENFGGTIFVTNGSPEFVDCSIADSSADTTFEARSIFGPNAPDDIFVSYGGAIAMEDAASTKFIDCDVTNSEACIGGGIWCSNAELTLTDCSITDSTAYHGGGLYSVNSDGTITGCTIVRNRAYDAPVPEYDDPNLTFEYPAVFGQGGGYYCFSSAVEIADSVFSENRASASGGGIYFGGSDQDLYSTPLLHNCLVIRNKAGIDGGGISSNWLAEPTISNCTIADNLVSNAGAFGGGLYCSYQNTTEVIDSIIWGNRGANGSQIAIAAGSHLTVTYSDIGPPYDPNQSFGLNLFGAGGSGQGGSGTVLVDGQTIYDQFDAGQERVKVIVSLGEPVELRAATSWDWPQSVDSLRAEIARRQSLVLSSLTSGEFTLRYQYENQAGFSGEVTAGGLDKLLSNPSVAHIEPVRYVQPALAQAIPLANALEARQLFDGTGMAIAIVDTGVDYNHPMLGGGGFPNTKVIGGYDFGMGDADPWPTDPTPVYEGHGTACAGIAAGDLATVEDYIGGVAYGAKIYALRLTTDEGEWPTDSTLAAWDWCITHRNDDPANPIMVTSNSWGWGGLPFDNPDDADAFSPAHTVAADTSVTVGITILAASGNDGFAGQGISWPSAMSDVISVGAVYDTTDEVTGYSNTADNLDILAPADPVYTTDVLGERGATDGDYWPDFSGTSSACPFAAGCVACVQSAAMTKFGSYLTPAEVRYFLIMTGDPVTDTKVDITKPRVNLGAAIAGLSYGPPVYIEQGCILNDWEAPDTNNYWHWDVNTWNGNTIEDDPNFILGYYLSHIQTGQDADSPCIDTGSAPANDPNIGLDTYTTRIDGEVDDANVDMGYHYRERLTQYGLTIIVVDGNGTPIVDPNLWDGTVEPNRPRPVSHDPNTNTYNFYANSEVLLVAEPNEGYRVEAWTGTDNVPGTGSNENTVTMTRDRTVTVEFGPRPVFNLYLSVAGGLGTVEADYPEPLYSDPNSGIYTYYDSTQVLLIATPDDANYEVKVWSGTDDDFSREPNNTVTINGSDAYVTVTFGLTGQNDIYIERDPNTFYPTIQAAINAAIYEGDVVIVTDGFYIGPGNRDLHFRGVPITVRSQDGPASCYIYCGGTGTDPHRGFIFDSNEDPNYIVEGFSISGGYADFGGGLYYDGNSSPLVQNCIITGNTATDGGGGIYLQNTPGDPEVDDPNALPAPRISNCRIMGNYSMGDGGGIYCTNAFPVITNAEINGNRAGGFGGGVYCQSGSAPQIINCLIVYNWSTEIGGSIYLWGSPAVIHFCTIMYNYGYEYPTDEIPGPGPKGGICARESDPTITHCIIGRNGGTWAWGFWGDGWTHGDDLYECSATYSCIENGDEGEGNISDNPLLTSGGLGAFYLSQWAGGQTQNSPCIDAGQEFAVGDILGDPNYNLGDVTTCIQNIPDTGPADIGFHYPYYDGPPVMYTLWMSVTGNGYLRAEYHSYYDTNDIIVEVNEATSPADVNFTPGSMVTLIAVPDANHRVLRWLGTDHPEFKGNYNTVTMSSSRWVSVEFELSSRRTLHVGGSFGYTSIQTAIDDAKDGDTITIETGEYPGTGYTVLGKNITIVGNPADPNSVVINCQNEIEGGFHLLGTPRGTCVLNGVTITNVNTYIVNAPDPEDPGQRGWDGGDNLPYVSMDTYGGMFTGTGYFGSNSGITVIGNHIIANCIVRNCSVTGGNASGGNDGEDEGQPGGDGGHGGSAGGAGIYIGDVFAYEYVDDPCDPYGYGQELFRWGSSPTIVDCKIENCSANGANGGDGGTGADYGHGGSGGLAGQALGAGIFCDVGTQPTFIDCTVTNCGGTGGNGGNGGDGGEWAAGGYGGLTYADPNQGDPAKFSARGGGVYCAVLSEPNFIGCTFRDNVVDGSVSGLGGFGWSGVQAQPRRNYNIPSYGAGVYCGSGCRAAFKNCTAQGNRTTYYASQPTGYGGGICLEGKRASLDPNDIYSYSSYMGIYYYSYYEFGPIEADFADCNFADNSASIGGGVYWTASDVEMVDCNFVDNSSYVGGGLFSLDSVADISGCVVRGNMVSEAASAGQPVGPNEPNDPNAVPVVIYGAGGGFYVFTTDANIFDCVFTENTATGSGGGLYLGGHPESTADLGYIAVPELTNCLIAENISSRNGGGVSCDRLVEAGISNCTIAGNRLTQMPSYGGGLYCTYGSTVDVIDSIIWGNSGVNGSQVAIEDEPSYPLPSTVTITNSDVEVAQERPDAAGPGVDPGLIDPNVADYFIYSQIDTNDYNAAGSYGADGWVGNDGTDRVIFYDSNTAYILTVTVPEGANPDMHPNNPYCPGPNAPRTFNLERTFDLGVTLGHQDEFYVDAANNEIYLGASGGIRKYVWDPAYEGGGSYVYDSTIAPASPEREGYSTQTLAYDPDNDTWYAGSISWNNEPGVTEREMWKYDAVQGPNGVWELAFTYTTPEGTDPMCHHDGMEFVNGYLFLADYMGDYMKQYTTDGTLVNVYFHEPLEHELEGMGWGALGHFWAGSHVTALTEFGGGALGEMARRRGAPIYVDSTCTLYGWEPNDPNDFWSWDVNSWHEDTNNIDADPLFVAGYYLSWWDAGQDANSPCVDIGSDFASNLGMDVFTTRTDGINDQNEVDLGYHYSCGITRYGLTLSIVDANGDPIADPNLIYGAVAPNEPRWVDYNSVTNTYTFYADTQVTLVADPCDGYRVKAWSGTDDDSPAEPNITVVTMTADKSVGVEFEPIPVYQLQLGVVGGKGTVEVDYPEPIDFNSVTGIYTYYDGTEVVLIATPLAPNYRVKVWTGTDDNTSTDPSNTVTMDDHKEVTVEFELPQTIKVSVLDEPNAIQDAIDRARSRDTLIVGAGTYTTNGINLRGKDIVVTSTNPDDADVVAATIIDCGQGGRAFIFNSGEDANTIVRGFTIVNANVTGENGGAIYVGSNCSPKIASLVISNCSASPDPDTGAGGYGGGIYVTGDSEPNFVNCTVTDCNAEGGGGAYCDSKSSPTFWECTFSENSADFGGGMLCNSARLITVRDCNFANNLAPSGAGLYGEPNSIVAVEGGVFVGNVAANQGGAMYWEAATMWITDSSIVDNAAQYGGGLYCIYSPDTEIIGCTISYNRSPNDVLDPNDLNDPNALLVGQGAGIYCFATPALIRDCVITRNTANTSGGGVYLIGQSNSPQVINCLIIYNLAGRDGGGISVNWLADPLIANCTIVGNAAPGIFGKSGTGLGGGFYCAYDSNAVIVDSILWNNNAVHGWEIAVGSGFDPDPIPSTLTVTYSNVKGGRSGSHVENLCELWGWYPGDTSYPSNIEADPLFVTGPLGDFYLSQTNAGQLQDSPCVDTGSDLAVNLDMMTDRDMNRYTTRTDQVLDRGTVDMGYHYTTMGEPCRFCDLVYDGLINFSDFAVLAMRWLNEGCSEANDWCEGADLSLDMYVDFEDLAILARCWLVRDDEAPEPDPAQWEVEPYSTSETSIAMTAKTAVDAWGWEVEYYFDCFNDDNFSTPDWQLSPAYEATSLTQGAEYCFRVRARDGVGWIPDDTGEPGNKTDWSVIRCAIAGGGPDTTPPYPPEIIFIAPTSPNSITMTASLAHDASGVEYRFKRISPEHYSDWLDEPNWTDVGLETETQYCYVVMARDKSPQQNPTAWSDPPVCEFTLPPEDITVPDPNPAAWDTTTDANGFTGEPRQVYVGPTDFDWWAEMRAEPATDASGVEYKFVCTDSTFNSGGSQDQLYGDGVEWRNETNVLGDPRVYRVKVGGSYVDVSFYVIVRDRSPNHNTTLPSETLSWR